MTTDLRPAADPANPAVRRAAVPKGYGSVSVLFWALACRAQPDL